MKRRIIPFKKPNSNFLDYLKCGDIFLNKSYIRGKYNNLFSKRFAEQNGCKYGLNTNSGTTALYLALQALDLPKKSEIITVSNTFIATITSIEANGFIPVFADIGDDLNILPESIEKLITKNTKVILGVHLNGIIYDYKRIKKIADKYNLLIIADACQAHYSSVGGKKIGELADITCFSFYPSKTIDVGGEGGMLITNNNKLYEKLKDILNYPDSGKIGLNFYMSEFHAKIGYIQTFKRDKLINSLSNKKKYFLNKLKYIKNVRLVKGIELEGTVLCYFPLLVDNRDGLLKFLNNSGVDGRVNYKKLIHKNRINYNGIFDNTENFHKKLIHLPYYSKMGKKDIYYIIQLIEKFYDKNL